MFNIICLSKGDNAAASPGLWVLRGLPYVHLKQPRQPENPRRHRRHRVGGGEIGVIDSLNPEFRIDSIFKGMRPRGGLRLPGARARAEDRRPPHEDLSAPTPAGTFRTHLPYVNSPCMKDRFRKLFH